MTATILTVKSKSSNSIISYHHPYHRDNHLPIKPLEKTKLIQIIQFKKQNSFSSSSSSLIAFNSTPHSIPLNHFTPSPSSSSLLSFPTKPLPTPFAFNFPLPTPSRHSPPPHPGPRHVVSFHSPIQSHSHTFNDNRRRPIYQPQNSHLTQSYHFLPTHSSSLISEPSKRKRRIFLPPIQPNRSKKIKLVHSYFRSPQIFYPLALSHPPSLNHSSPTSSPKSSSSTRSLVMESPKWLYTSPASEGHSSKLSPQESQFTGIPHTSCVSPGSKPTFSSPSFNVQLSSSSRPTHSTLYSKNTRNLTPIGSHAAPLKAQLLAVLRMRSSLQPGEAALRLKKWVIWNSWVRGQTQTRVYPNVNFSTDTNSTCQQPRATSLNELSHDEWTGDEMFDENGDLVCETEELDINQETDQFSYSLHRPNSKVGLVKAENNASSKFPGITRSKVPSRINTSQYPSNLTPPSSPESQRSHNDKINPIHDSCTSPVHVINQSNLNMVPKTDQKPLTPPPSPTN